MIVGIIASCGYPIQNGVNTFAPILGTTYYKFHETLATARGPVGAGLPLEDFNYSVWSAFQDGTDIVAERFNGTIWTDRTVLTSDVSDRITHISLTFDQLGNFACAYEMNGNIRLRWYDSLLPGNVTTTIAAGKSPFISMDTFTSYMGARQIRLVYIKPNKDMIYRLQSDRYTEEFPIISGVDDILSMGVTQYNNLKVVYTDTDSGDQRISNIATARRGIWQGDGFEQTVVVDSIVFEVRSASTFSETEPTSDSVEMTNTFTVNSVSIVNSVITADDLVNDSVEMTNTFTVNSVSIVNAMIDATLTEPEPSVAMIHTFSNVTITVV